MSGVMLLCALFSGCGKAKQRYETRYLDLFDTVTQVVVYAESQEQAQQDFDGIYRQLRFYHEQFDIYHEYSGMANLKTVNGNAGQRPVAVDDCILDLLEQAKALHDLTDGRVNVAMGSVLSLWHTSRTLGMADPAQAALPQMAQLQEANQHTDIHDLILDRQQKTVAFADPKLRLDVGAIAKGYAAEQVTTWAAEQGMESLLISIGGNVQALGGRADGKPWQAAVQAPDGNGLLLYRINVNDNSLVTSGSYQRYFTVGGRAYHHIIDPSTLMPAEGLISVSVLCPDAALADGLSTALFCMPLQEGLALAESLENVEALFITSDGEERCTSGFLSYSVE